MRHLYALAILACLGLTDCGANTSGAITAATSFHVTQKEVDAAKATYVTFGKAARAYLALPRCSETVTSLCATHANVAKIKQVNRIVYADIKDVQAKVSAGDATGAIAAYQILTRALDDAQKLSQAL